MRFRGYAPAGLTSRMMGFPATCRKVVPTPSAKMQASRSAKLGARSAGTRTAAALMARPTASTLFLPACAANTPAGTLKTAKATKTKNGSSVDTTLLRRKLVRTASAIGPIASATPITKKVRKMGTVRSRMRGER